MRKLKLSCASLSLLLFLIEPPVASAQLAGSFARVGEMTEGRSGHTATLMTDGRVLIAGGCGSIAMLSSADLYDPSTAAFTPTGRMNAARCGHTATLLTDGRVLVAGGRGLSSAETYDPATGAFTPAGALIEDQFNHTATLLPDGKVLIAGGERSAPPFPTAARPELFDPATGGFSLMAPYAGNGTLYPGAGGPVWPTANLLRDGRVLIVGENPSEIFDSTTGTFSFTGAMINRAYSYGMD